MIFTTNFGTSALVDYIVIMFKFDNIFHTKNYTFIFIKKKHGKDIIMTVKSYELLKTKLIKVQYKI